MNIRFVFRCHSLQAILGDIAKSLAKQDEQLREKLEEISQKNLAKEVELETMKERGREAEVSILEEESNDGSPSSISGLMADTYSS